MPNFTKARGLSRAFRLTPAIVSREIRAARSAKERITITDTGCPGLRLIIGARTATWSVTARPRGLDANGKRFPLKTFAIDDATEIDPETARKAAVNIKREISLGRDPVAERREQRRQQAHAARSVIDKRNADAAMLERVLRGQTPTVGKQVAILDYTVLANASLADCAKAFLAHGAIGGHHHLGQTRRHLRLALAEMRADGLKPTELGKQHVRGLVDLHIKAGRQATARHRYGSVSRLYKWLMAVDVIETNPAASAKPPAPPAPRSSVPGAKTVKALWDIAERLPATRTAFIKLSLLLPLRRQELADLKIKNIVLDSGGAEIRLVASETKNRKPFVLPLTGTALEIVQGLLLRSVEPDDFLIPLAKRGGAFADWGGLAKQIARAGDGLRFQWHDTRRMFASEMAEHGLSNFGIIDGLLNHQRSASLAGVARSYHHSVEKPARTAAMAAWDRILLHAAEYGLWPRQMPTTHDNVVLLAANRIP